MLRSTTIYLGLALSAVLSGCHKAPPTVESSAPQRAPEEVSVRLFPKLATFVDTLPAGFSGIPDDRKKMLVDLAGFVKKRRLANEPARLLFVCTRNSRRSHMGQIFATVAADKYGIDGVESFSGGSEVTAFNPRAVAAFERVGFDVTSSGGDNPLYKIFYATDRPAIDAFSKRSDDPLNPADGFAAIMTCGADDKGCTPVRGASLTVQLRYDDPSSSDGTPEEAAMYDARAKQIATEVFYMFSRVKS